MCMSFLLATPGSMSSLQRTILEETALRGIEHRGQILKTIGTEGAQGPPHKLPS